MAKYRKRPLVIEAEPYRPGLEDGIEEINAHMMVDGKGIPTPFINTLEGKHYISPTDYIVTGIKGERYPVKQDIFEASYELVTDE
jgi:hypothetical protein